jgi:hypothetical protein
MSRIPHGEGAVGEKDRAEESGDGEKDQEPNDEIRMANDE